MDMDSRTAAMGDFEDEFEDEFESEDEMFEAGVDGRPDAEREADEGRSKPHARATHGSATTRHTHAAIR